MANGPKPEQKDKKKQTQRSNSTDESSAAKRSKKSPEQEQSVPLESDQEVENNAIADLLVNSTSPEERDYLLSTLEKDPQLAQVFDNVLTYASEFSGEGEVEGGTEGATDSIPARLDDGEFVIPSDAVEVIGADSLQSMVDEARAQNQPSPEEKSPARSRGGTSTPPQPSLLEKGKATPV